ERFRAKWAPVRVKKTRQNKKSRAVPTPSEPPLDRFLQFLDWAEDDLLAGLDVDGLAGGGVAAGPGGPLADLEDAKTDDADAVAFLEMLGDQVDHVGQDGLSVLFRQVLALRDVSGQVLERDGGGSGCLLRRILLSRILFTHVWPP